MSLFIWLKQKKAVPPFPGNPAFAVPSGSPAIRPVADPWLSVPRLLGVWLYHEWNLIIALIISINNPF
jgi:hypothetical protein